LALLGLLDKFKKSKVPDWSAERLVIEADKEIKTKNYQLALDYLNKSIKKEPDNTATLRLKIDVLYDFEKYDDCIKLCEKYVKIDSEYSYIFLKLGNMYFLKNKNSKAIDNYKKASEMDSWTIDDFCKWASLCFNKDRLEIIEFFYDEALVLESKNPKVLSLKAQAYLKYGKYKDAINYFEKSLEIEPNNVVTLNQIGRTYSKRGKGEQALEYHEKVLGFDKNQHVAIIGRGFAFLSMGKIDEAISIFEPLTTSNLFGALMGMGEAVQKYKKFLKGHPRFDEAENYFKRAIDLDPKDPEPWICLASYYADSKSYRKFSNEVLLNCYKNAIECNDLTNIAIKKYNNIQKQITKTKKQNEKIRKQNEKMKNQINKTANNDGGDSLGWKLVSGSFSLMGSFISGPKMNGNDNSEIRYNYGDRPGMMRD